MQKNKVMTHKHKKFMAVRLRGGGGVGGCTDSGCPRQQHYEKRSFKNLSTMNGYRWYSTVHKQTVGILYVAVRDD